MRLIGFVLALLAVVAGLSPAAAAVTVTFMSRDFGESFPHAFIEVTGATDADPATKVDTNYGFTATAVSPAILLGPVKGEVMAVTPIYVGKSQRHFSLQLDDARYAQLLALIDQWRTLPGRSYDLHKRNCVSFVAAVARSLGLAADDDPKLMLKPRSFLEEVRANNPGVDTSTATVPALDPNAKLNPAFAGEGAR